VRARRLGSYALDLFFASAPWAALLGLALDPNLPQGMGSVGILVVVCAFGAIATLAVLVVQAVTFLSWGRTLGMACAGVAAQKGSRLLGLALEVAMVAGAVAFAFVLPAALDGSTRNLLMGVAPAAALALNGAFALGPSGRTLLDRASGVVLAKEPPGPRRSAGVVVDVLLLAAAGAPVLGAVDWDDFGGAAIASGVTALALGAVEIALFAKTGASIGVRAVARRQQP